MLKKRNEARAERTGSYAIAKSDLINHLVGSDVIECTASDEIVGTELMQLPAPEVAPIQI